MTEKIKTFIGFTGWFNIGLCLLILVAPLVSFFPVSDAVRSAVLLVQLCALSHLFGEARGYRRGERLWKPLVELSQKNFSEIKGLFDRQNQVAKEWESIARKMGYTDRPTSQRNTYFEDN